MSIKCEDADHQGGIPSPDVPSPRSSGNARLRDDDNDNLTCHSSQEFEDAKQEKNSIALPQFQSKKIVNPSHFDSYQIYNLFNPARGIRDEMVRKGIAPRNHHKANVAAIAIKSAKVHANKEALPVADESLEGLPKGGKANVPPSSRSSIQGISKLRSQEHIDQTGPHMPDDLSTTTESSLTKSRKNGDKVNYLARNKSSLASVAEIGRKKRDFTAPEVPANENYGKIPPYLLRRKLELLHCKEQMEQEERDRHLPPGLILMRDEERLEVLKTLEENKERLVAKLRGLPLIIETPSLIRAKGEIDSQLKEVEDSIKRFSRPKVYIRYTT
ncbi:unnamed protein product [Calypogeia fissa]